MREKFVFIDMLFAIAVALVFAGILFFACYLLLIAG